MSEDPHEEFRRLVESMLETMQTMIKNNKRILSLVQLRQAEKAREEFFAQAAEYTTPENAVRGATVLATALYRLAY